MLAWIRITKSAGTTLDKHFPNNVQKFTPTPENLNSFKTRKWSIIMTVIRNPFEKVYSAYKFLLFDSNDRCKDILPNSKISFKEFLEKIQELRKDYKKYGLEKINNIFCIKEEKELTNQVYWILQHMESSYDSISFFINIKSPRLRIFKLDNMEKSIQTIIHDFKIKKNHNIGKSRNGDEIDLQNFSRDTQVLFKQMYQKDIDLYNSIS